MMKESVGTLCASMLIGLAAACSSVPSDVTNSVSTQLDESQRHIKFTATEFTRPKIEISPNGKEFYFDALGEIYRAPLEGGVAIKLDLGGGWKTEPMLSRGGKRIAFISDRGVGTGVWGRSLASKDDVQPYADRANEDVVSAAWIADSQLAMVHMTTVSPSPLTLSVTELDASGSRISLEPVVAKTDIRHLIGSGSDQNSLYLYADGLILANIRTGVSIQLAASWEGLTGQVRVSNDGRLAGYAAERDGRTILVVNDLASGKQSITRCELERSLEDPRMILPSPTYAFMPDGESVLLSRRGKFHRCRFDGKTKEVPVSAMIDVNVAPRAMRSAASEARHQIRHVDFDSTRGEITFMAKGHLWRAAVSGSDATRVTSGNEEEFMPAYSPDGSKLAYVTLDDGVSTLRVRDIESGRHEVITASSEHSYASPTWSQDGAKIAFFEVDQRNKYSDGTIKYVNVPGQTFGVFGQRGNVRSAGGVYPNLVWSLKGDGIYYTRAAGLNTVELVYHAVGGKPVTVLTFPSSVLDAIVSPSGRHIALVDRQGVSVAPLVASVHSPASPRHLTLTETREMHRIPISGVDYVRWTANDRLLWSVQDDVFMSNDLKSSSKIFRFALSGAEPHQQEVNVYAGGRIITMAKPGVIENGAIVIAGAKILFVGNASDLPIAFQSIKPIDVSGKTVIPGLIDVHFHHSPVDIDDLVSQDEYALFANAAFGVTTVFDPSISTVKSSYLTQLSRDDEFRGATFYGSGTSLIGNDVHFAAATIAGIDDARGYVERLAIAGAPLIKAYLRPSRRDRQHILQAARELGVGVVSHETPFLRTQLGTVQDGYTGIEHTFPFRPAPLYSDVTQFLKEGGVAMTPTLAISGSIKEYMARRTKRDMRSSCLVANSDKITSSDAERARHELDQSAIEEFAWEKLIENARMLNDGMRISIGGHDEPPGLMTHWEMWSLALGGATPINVLKAATLNGAMKLNMHNRIGSLAVGMDADFVILNANPLDDIYNTADIERVVRRGRTLQWPQGSRWPLSWPINGDWNACMDWNLGGSRRGSAASLLH